MVLRSTALVVPLLLLANLAAGGEAHAISADGTVWTATTTLRGLQLTGVQDGEITASALLRVPFGGSPRWDRDIQVVIDPLTEKVALVWRRQRDEGLAEIHLAVLADGTWERTAVLSANPAKNPREPVIQLVDQPIRGQKDTMASYLEVVWWEGQDDTPIMRIVLLELAAEGGDDEALVYLTGSEHADPIDSALLAVEEAFSVARSHGDRFSSFRNRSGGRYVV